MTGTNKTVRKASAMRNRFEMRVNTEEKDTIERAATMAGLTVSAYIRSCVIQSARADIDRLETIVLSNRDRDLFLSAIEDATPSTGKLQQAFSRFRQKYEGA